MAETLDSVFAGTELNRFLESKGCDCSQALTNVTRNFQTTYNSDVSSGKITDANTISTDGQYGEGTQDALLRVLGVAPDPCYGDGKPCSRIVRLPPNVPVVVPPVQPPAVIPPTNPAVQPVNLQTTTSKTNWAPWIIGGLAIAAGAGLVYMMSQQKKKKPRALRENPVRRRRSKKRRSRRARR